MKEEDQYSINNNNNNFHHTYHHQEQQQQQQQQLLLQQQIMIQQQQSMMFPNSSIPSDQAISSASPWPNNIPQYPAFNNHHPHFLQPPSNSSSLPYATFFNNNNRRVGVPSMHHQFASSSYEGPSTNDHLRIISETLQHHHHHHHQGVVGPFGLQAEIGKMTAQEIMEAKALAASKSHSEAERRRRERINNHLAKLRTLLPSTTKTDKASLLAEVIQHVKELKRQTSVIAETSPVPTESDELTVDDASDEDGKFVIKASLCCEDRSDLLPELIKTLKSLRLRTLKADITTLGGRVKNVLFITAENENDNEDYYSSSNSEEDNINNNNNNSDHYQQQQQYCISSIQEALRAVMEKSVGNSNESASSSVKRQRTNMISIS